MGSVDVAMQDLDDDIQLLDIDSLPDVSPERREKRRLKLYLLRYPLAQPPEQATAYTSRFKANLSRLLEFRADESFPLGSRTLPGGNAASTMYRWLDGNTDRRKII